MTTRRRLLVSLLALPLGAGLTACGRPPAAKPAEGFRVALLTPGPVSDAGWNAGAFEGLKAIERELGAKVSHVQVKTPSEFNFMISEGKFARFGARKIDAVIDQVVDHRTGRTDHDVHALVPVLPVTSA
nr:hypothetical protein [Thermoanaerobaculia bacterium]